MKQFQFLIEYFHKLDSFVILGFNISFWLNAFLIHHSFLCGLTFFFIHLEIFLFSCFVYWFYLYYVHRIARYRFLPYTKTKNPVWNIHINVYLSIYLTKVSVRKVVPFLINHISNCELFHSWANSIWYWLSQFMMCLWLERIESLTNKMQKK